MAAELGRRAAEWLWYADGLPVELARAVLWPAEALMQVAVARRGQHFDHALREGRLPAMALPALSVGNLTVGGTGKTPVAAWFAARLRERGAKPALVMRGYGDDEWRVHQVLNPAVPVLRNPDRVQGTVEAARAGADCAVLDDAFQHRRACRVADVVLLSADRFGPTVRLLPTGPYREPLSALQRATAIVLTVKAAGQEQVDRVLEAVQRAAPEVGVAVLRLLPGPLRQLSVSGSDGGLASVASSPPDTVHSHEPGPVVLVSAIADPQAFETQVRGCGLDVRAHLTFGDHHTFTPADVATVLARAALQRGGAGITPSVRVVCTLKDAVKLSPLWPRVGPALWYVSQHVAVERGAALLDQQVERVIIARDAAVPPPG
jgi:tetraacyldisaccharide 4'-kinase